MLEYTDGIMTKARPHRQPVLYNHRENTKYIIPTNSLMIKCIYLFMFCLRSLLITVTKTRTSAKLFSLLKN